MQRSIGFGLTSDSVEKRGALFFSQAQSVVMQKQNKLILR